MLIGWRSQHKHHPDRPRAAGIVDGDATAQKTEFNSHPKNTMSGKCFVYPKPRYIRPALAAGFRVPVTLEVLYPRAVWEAALEGEQLTQRNPIGVYPESLVKDLALGAAQPGDRIADAWRIFVDYDFSPEAKIRTANQMARLPDNQARAHLTEFEVLLTDVLGFLGCIE